MGQWGATAVVGNVKLVAHVETSAFEPIYEGAIVDSIMPLDRVPPEIDVELMTIRLAFLYQPHDLWVEWIAAGCPPITGGQAPPKQG